MAIILEIDNSRHGDLEENDTCYYLRDYTSGIGYMGGPTNSLILNLKKEVKYKGTDQYKYKDWAINKVADELILGMENELLIENPIFCPIPPSKSKSHQDYDDRLVQVLNKVNSKVPIRLMELIVTGVSHVAQHSAISRLSLEDLKAKLSFVNPGVDLNNETIVLFDDLITNGRHFKACKEILLEIYPNAEIYGLFVARRV